MSDLEDGAQSQILELPQLRSLEKIDTLSEHDGFAPQRSICEVMTGLKSGQCRSPSMMAKPPKAVCLDDREDDMISFDIDPNSHGADQVDEDGVDQTARFRAYASKPNNQGSDDLQAEELEGHLDIDPKELIFGSSVGSGATADVFEGHWNGQKVAIKEIELHRRKEGRSELRQQVAFMREVAVMSKVTHTNLVNFFGICLSARPLRVITEFCDGGTMFRLLHEDDALLLWAQNLKMCLDVAHAMNYLHSFQPQIIHRDLKSLNLLLMRRIQSTADVPFVKVSDFGMSRMKDADPDSQWGKMTKYAGTCHWMAPEVSSGVYDERADVYSFAMVLFEIVCREIPFGDVEGKEVLMFISEGFRPDMEAVLPDCPAALKDLMVTCWAHCPRSRPTFSQILEELAKIDAAV